METGVFVVIVIQLKFSLCHTLLFIHFFTNVAWEHSPINFLHTSLLWCCFLGNLTWHPNTIGARRSTRKQTRKWKFKAGFLTDQLVIDEVWLTLDILWWCSNKYCLQWQTEIGHKCKRKGYGYNSSGTCKGFDEVAITKLTELHRSCWMNTLEKDNERLMVIYRQYETPWKSCKILSSSTIRRKKKLKIGPRSW